MHRPDHRLRPPWPAGAADNAVGSRDATDVFVGRQIEIAALRQWLNTAASGHGQVVLVEGDGGVGKTALVERFLAMIGDDVLVMRSSGDEAESDLAFEVLARLQESVRSAEPVPAARRPLADVEAFTVGAELLGLLDRLQSGDRTVVIVVDDLHLADPASIRALAFAARRLDADKALMVVTARPGILAGWDHVLSLPASHRMLLEGLMPLELADLAVQVGAARLTPRAAQRLHDLTDGHPLYAHALLRSVDIDSLGLGDSHRPLPVSPDLAEVVLARWRGCSSMAADLVAAAAVLGRRGELSLAVSIAGVTDGAAALGEAIGSGLLVEAPGAQGPEFRFSHALVRAAVYQDLGPTRRMELHLQAAAATGGDVRLRHRVAAATGPDEALADDLEAEAISALDRGAGLEAAERFRQSAQVSPPGTARDRRLLNAVEGFLEAGEGERAFQLEPAVTSCRPGPHRSYVASYLALMAGRVVEAEAGLREAWAGLEAGTAHTGPVDLAGRVAVNMANLTTYDFRGDEMVDWGESAVVHAGPGPAAQSFAWFARTLALGAVGRADEALDLLAGPGTPSGADVLIGRGVMSLWRGHPRRATEDLSTAFARARGGEPLRVTQGLGYLVEAEYRLGNFDQAIVHSELALESSYDAGRVWDFPLLHSLAVFPRAARGDFEEAAAHVESARQWADLVPFAGARAYAALGRMALALARCDWRAVEEATRVLDATYDGAEPGNHVFGPALAEALFEQGQIEEARLALEEFEKRASKVSRVSAQLGAARVRGMVEAALGNHGAADHEFALGHDLADHLELPLEAGRLAEAHGRALASAGRTADARLQLEDAARRFEALGARPYAERARQDLVRLGSTAQAPDGMRLTPTETVVAHLVAEGLTNRAIAEQLMVSVKGVEYHLTNVYRRLGVSSRTNLIRMLSAQDRNRPGDTSDVDPGSNK